MSAAEFIRFWLDSHGHRHAASPYTVNCRRIEWRYIDKETT